MHEIADLQQSRKELFQLRNEISNITKQETAIEEELTQFKITKARELRDAKLKIEKEIREKVQKENLVTTQAEKDNLIQQETELLEARMESRRILAREDASLNQAQLDAKLAAIDAEDQAERANIKKRADDALQEGQIKVDKLRAEANKKLENSMAKKQKDLEKQAGEAVVKEYTEAFGKGKTIQERWTAIKDAWTNDEGSTDILKGLTETAKGLSEFVKSLDTIIESVASQKSKIDTRLQGSANRDTTAGSYWGSISSKITGIAAVSPLVKQEDIVKNIDELVDKGINYNLEQRAFLMTIKDKIASTFSATDGTLLRLIRLQQQDSTAARLGMESAMTAFLNNMYETTEYLSDIASSVRSSLKEAEALMNSQSAVEFEYQVQKWLGSLYSVGMSDTAVSNISNTLGQLASGQISGVTSGGTSNLLLMAANRANISIADALSDGLDASETNTLMQATVNYLAEIYGQTEDSLLLQQQYASVFGMTASDLRAAVNLAQGSTVNDIANNNLSYNNAITQLYNMADSMYQRTSINEMLTNATSNLTYTMAAGIGSNPVLYSIYKMAGLLDDTVGGINIPAISVVGSGVDLNATVSDLMRVAALSGSIISGLGSVLGNATAGAGFSGSGMLQALGVSGNSASVSRGTGAGLATSGVTVSSSGSYASNGNSTDVQNKTLTDANDSAKQQLVETQESEDSDVPNKTINENVVKIYELLNEVSSGTASFNVKISDYGLVWNR